MTKAKTTKKRTVGANLRVRPGQTHRSAPTKEIGVRKPDSRVVYLPGGTRDKYRSYPSSGLTPESLASYLQSADGGQTDRQAELFGDMLEKDARLRGLMQTRILGVTGCDWEVRPFSDDPEDQKTAEMAEDILSKIPKFTLRLKDLLSGIGYGYSLTEIIWQSNGAARPQELRHIPHKNISFYKDFPRPRILTDQDSLNGVELTQNKFIYHEHHTTTGFAHRGGLLRPLSWLYLFKNYTLKDWVRFAEAYGMPLRLGKYPPGVGDADKKAIIEALETLATDAAGIIPEGAAIEFVQAAVRQGVDIYAELKKTCELDMAICILGQNLSSEVQGGSYAAAKTHGEVRYDIVKDDAEQLSETIRDQLIKPIIIFNRGIEYAERLPWFKILYEPPEDLEKLALRDKTLVEMGLPIPVRYALEKYNIPEAEGDEPVIQRNLNPFPSFPGGGESPLNPPFDKGGKGGFNQGAARACPGCGHTPRSPLDRGDRGIVGARSPRPEPVTPQDILRTEDFYIASSVPWLRQWRGNVEKFFSRVKNLEEAQRGIESLKENTPSGFQDFVYDSSIYGLLYGIWEERQRLVRRKGAATAPLQAQIQTNPFGLPPREAIAWFRQKAVVTPEEFSKLDEIARPRAFSIKGVQDKYVLESVKKEIERGLKEGITFSDFKESVDDIFNRAGLDPKSPWHLETVYRNNVQQAYQSGHEKQAMETADIRPYGQYFTVGDDRVRPAHAALHGIVLPLEEIRRRKIWPPNGHRCRCSIVTVSELELREEGLTVAREIPMVKGFEFPDPGFATNPWEAFANFG